MEQADIVIIGSGQGGVPLARSFAADGRDVVLFERAKFGGTCVNYGCLPSKAFLASAHAAAAARRAIDLGIHAQVTVDFPAVMERARGVIQRSQNGVHKGLRDAGVCIVQAEASFSGERSVKGDDVEVEAETIVINTGKSPTLPPIDGLDEVDYLTYANFWELTELPPRTLVIGGGYVGVELAQGLARLGSEVTVAERSSRLVQNETEDVSQILADALRADNVELLFSTQVDAVHQDENGIHAELQDGRTLQADALLIATGRKANTRRLKADVAGIALDEKGHIQVDAHFATTNPHVYAIGDVTGQAAFTHVSWEDYRRLRDILQGGARRQRDRVLAYVFFTEPQVGRVGLTLQQAREAGYAAKVASLPLEQVARGRLTGHTEGFFRMVIDEESDKILGATLVGPEAGELIHTFLAHIEAGSTWQVLERSVHVHPTYAEGLPVLARKFAD